MSVNDRQLLYVPEPPRNTLLATGRVPHSHRLRITSARTPGHPLARHQPCHTKMTLSRRHDTFQRDSTFSQIHWVLVQHLLSPCHLRCPSPTCPRGTGSSQGVTGRTVFKDFGKHGIHKGIVEAHDAPSDLYHVVYADGDEEDLTKAEVNELWSPDFTPKHKRSRLQRGDRVRAAPTLFDVTDPVEGEPLYSSEHPNWCYGEVCSVSNGIAKIKWEGGMEGSVNTRDLIRVGPVSSDDSSDFIDNGAGATLLQAPQYEHSPPTATTQPSSSKAKQRRARKLRLPSRTAVSRPS